MPRQELCERRPWTDDGMFRTTLTNSKPRASSEQQLCSAIYLHVLSFSRLAFTLWAAIALIILIQACAIWMNMKAQ